MMSSEKILKKFFVDQKDRNSWLKAPMLSRFTQGYFYYPGAGYDWSPLVRYSDKGLFSAFVYVDYYLSRANVLNSLSDLPGFQIIQVDNIGPGTTNGVELSWANYYDKERLHHLNHHGRECFIVRITLQNQLAQVVDLFYFGTEAKGTSRILLKSSGVPSCVVVQDYGGEIVGSDLFSIFNSNEFNRDLRPKFIYVDERTEPWPGYERISEYEEQLYANASHLKKALFRKSGRS